MQVSNPRMPCFSTAHTAVYETPMGLLHVTYEQETVLSLNFHGGMTEASVPSVCSDTAAQQILEYLSGERQIFTIPYRLSGTPFQKLVWEAISMIPYGSTSSYSEIAQVIGQPSSVRAVASACGKNPLLILIPCHRIIGKDGTLHGYAGGIEMKQKLLTLEQQLSSPAKT